jgi:hypothetical protein
LPLRGEGLKSEVGYQASPTTFCHSKARSAGEPAFLPGGAKKQVPRRARNDKTKMTNPSPRPKTHDLRRAPLFQLGGNEKLLRRIVVLDPQHIRLAADLAVFNIALAASRRFVD